MKKIIVFLIVLFILTIFASAENILITAQQLSTFTIPQTTVNVNKMLSQTYGYTDGTIGVSGLDVLIAAHIELFGSDFTPQTAQNYLAVNSSGWVTKVFGEKGDTFGFSVNGECLNDGVLNKYGTYTAYTIDYAPINDGDKVEFFYYADSYYLDNYVWFEKSGVKVDKIHIGVGKKIDLVLKGYCFCYNACNPKIPVENIIGSNLYIGANEYLLAKDATRITNEKGEVGLSFDNIGKFVVSAQASSNDYVVNIMPVLNVCVYNYFLMGDVSDNNYVSISDAIFLTQYLANPDVIKLSEKQSATSDVVFDNITDIRDLIKLKQYLSNPEQVTLD